MQRRALCALPFGLSFAALNRAVPAFAGEEAGELSHVEPLLADVAAATELVLEDPALALINSYRAAAGVAPARLHPALQQAAEGHVVYYDLNVGDPLLTGMGLHRQDPERPGFTGSTMGERARNAGYTSGSVTENAGFGRIESAINWAIHTVNHRLPLIHPSALDMGYSVSGGPEGRGFGIVDVGLRRDRLNEPLPSVYPADGATDVPTLWDGAETPDPAPGVPRPMGYPITVAFGLYQRVEWHTLELFHPSGELLPVSTPFTDWMRAAAIIPHQPLERGQTYTGRVEATVDGKRVSREWHFTTR
ncbi:MAG TPA: CAP domain-containing protein [Chloroflexota bacterium]|nr:CAP domain-containing protein [Chloroflexota bacterium]